MDTDRRATGDVRVFGCTACPRLSSVSARGWKAFRIEDPWDDEPVRLAFYCPDCARELDEDR